MKSKFLWSYREKHSSYNHTASTNNHHSFERALCLKINNRDAECKDFSLAGQLSGVRKFHLEKSQQEILTPEIFLHVYPLIKN